MTDVYSSHSEQYLQHDRDAMSTDMDSSNLKSPRSDQLSDSTSNSLDVDSMDSPNQSVPISRPLSRSSVASGLSVTATKDGIEGKRVKRAGIPGYPLNLINKMYTNYAKQHQLNLENEAGAYRTNDGSPLATPADAESADDLWSVQSIKSATSLIPQYDPSDRDIQSERGSILSNDQYHDASDHASKNLDFFDFDQTRASGNNGGESGQYGDIPQISIDNDSIPERR